MNRFASLLVLCFAAVATAGPVVHKLTAGDAAAADGLGHVVDVDGDTVVVGAPFDDHAGGADAGAAYVYFWTGTTWVQQAKLTAADAAAGDTFGRGVAVSGDTIVVGSRFDDDDGSLSGSAYVFVRSGTTWSQQAKLTASDASSGDQFGASVGIDGETVVVGAIKGESGTVFGGAAYVFVRAGTTWTEQAKLLASDVANSDDFGSRVAVSGDTILVGAHLDDDAGDSSGSAYVFERSGTTWTEQVKLTASDAAAGDRFGVGVAVDGDTVVIGSFNDDHAGGVDAGSAYVFERSGTTWTESAKLTAGDAAANDGFGLDVAIDGDRIVVGSILDDDAGSASGSAYVFAWSGAAWIQQSKLGACDGAAFDRFGFSVAIDGSRVLAGANEDDHAGGANAGSIYVLELDQTNVPPTAEAGENITILTQEQSGTTLTGAAADENGTTLACRWLRNGSVLASACDLDLGTLAALAIGDHTFVFEVSDCASVVTDTIVVTVNNSPPVSAPTGGGTYELVAGSTITLDGQVADFDGDTVTYEWRSGTTTLFGPQAIATSAGGDPVDLPALEVTASSLGIDVHTIQLIVDDGINTAVAGAVEVEVIDVTAPTLSLSASGSILWPPNHTMREVVIVADFADASGGEVTLSVEITSDEGGEEDHEVVSIDQESGEITLNLRAERKGKGDGRTYTITVTATDEANNSSIAVVTVVAPHDRRK